MRYVLIRSNTILSIMFIKMNYVLSIFCSLLFLLAPLVFVESSQFNITRGSSLSKSPNNKSSSIDNTTYWLSPSGTIAFGFYPLCRNCNRYVVGIWFVKSAYKTLVWSVKHKNRPLNNPSLKLVLNNDGKLVLRTTEGKEESLLSDALEPALYAKMHDNGNFVLYGSHSQIIWESFDYPTNTILGGQKLKDGQRLIAGVFRLNYWYEAFKLWVQQIEGSLMIYETNPINVTERKFYKLSSESTKRNDGNPIALNLDTTGRLYLVNWDGLVLRNFTGGENEQQQQQQNKCINDVIIYRATLETDGVNLYRERIGNEGEKPSVLWDSMIDERRSKHAQKKLKLIQYICFDVLLGLLDVLMIICTLVVHRKRRQSKREPSYIPIPTVDTF